LGGGDRKHHGYRPDLGDKVYKTPILTNRWMQWCTLHTSAMQGNKNRRTLIQARLSIKQEPISSDKMPAYQA
jgi:hypothetical protein